MLQRTGHQSAEKGVHVYAGSAILGAVNLIITHFWLSALLAGKDGGLVSSCIQFGERHALRVYY